MNMHETRQMIMGPVGDIELLITVPDDKIAEATVIICHPHPLFGGTMNNKVVTTMAKTFHEMGLHTVRFNFRGVGKTAGVHDAGNGETQDLLALIQWVKNQRAQDAIWLAGFSFGGFVAANAAAQINPARLITIAPQVSRFLTADIPPMTCPWLIIQGEQDDVVSPQELYAWADTLDPKPIVVRIPGAGHFFHGQLAELRKAIENNILA